MNDPRCAFGRCVIVASPGMYEMADMIFAKLATMCDWFSVTRVQQVDFSGDEMKPVLPESVRGMHAFLLHPMQQPHPAIQLVSLVFTHDALMRASVTGITDVLPFLSYTRQDKKGRERSSISIKKLADTIQTERLVRGLITFDLHVEQIAAAFDIPVENLEGSVVFAKHYRTVFGGDFSNVTILAADVGGANRARRFRNRLDKSIPICIIDKDHQPGPNNTEVLGFIGDPSGRDVLLIDDMIDTGGTLRNAIKATLERDARSVRSCATHGVLSGAAEAKFTEAGYEILTLNTIPRTAEYLARNSWLSHLPIDTMLANAIYEASLIGGSVIKLSN